MDFDVVLLWLALFYAVLLLASGRPILWRVKAVGLVAAAVPLAWYFPDVAGWAVGGAWILLLGMPMILAWVNARCVVSQHYLFGVISSRLLWVLHPERQWKYQARLLAALRQAQHGAFDAAMRGLAAIKDDSKAPPFLALSAHMHLRRLQDRWADLVAEAPWSVSNAATEWNATAAMVEMRALAALGDTEALANAQLGPGGELLAIRRSYPSAWAFGLLWLLSACGRTASVTRLLDGLLRRVPSSVRKFGLAVSMLRAGGDGRARALPLLGDVTRSRDADIAQSAARMLANPPKPAMLSERASYVVAAAEADLDGYLRARAARPRLRRSPVTLLLIMLNVAVYVLEVARGGSESEDVLMRLGALLPSSVIYQHQYWRLAAAMFLHLGWVHITMNMLALLVIGMATERAFGWWRMLATYVIAGLGSMAAVVWFVQEHWMADELLVGASGAIMGLVGGLLADAFRAWLHDRTRTTLLRLIWLLLVVALQSALDVATPQISFAGHASGLAIGFVVALIVGVRQTRFGPAASSSFVATRPPAPRLNRRDAAIFVVSASVALGIAVLFPEHKMRADSSDARPR